MTQYHLITEWSPIFVALQADDAATRSKVAAMKRKLMA
jgi:hypothetical protein